MARWASSLNSWRIGAKSDSWVAPPTTRPQKLATGRQPGALNPIQKSYTKILYKNPYGKFYTKIWILKGGGTGGVPPLRPLSPPSLRSRFVYRIFHMIFRKKCPVAFLWPENNLVFTVSSFLIAPAHFS